jgi:hypothetical protein
MLAQGSYCEALLYRVGGQHASAAVPGREHVLQGAMETAESQQAMVLAEIAQLHAAELRRQQAVIEDLSEQLAAATGRATSASGFVADTAGWVVVGAETSSEGKWRVEQTIDV